MADQTDCHICKHHLRKGGIWCVICKAYIHVSCSGLQSSKFYYDGFSYIQCYPEKILPHLLLPKTKSEPNGSNFKTRSRRIFLWKQSLLDELFTEAKSLQIQSRNSKQKKSKVNEEVEQFDKLMSTGIISAAIGCFSDKKSKGVLPLNEVIEGKTVLGILKEKHPQAKTAKTNYITEVSEDTMPHHPSIFKQINVKTVRKSTLKTHRSHGPSGLDASEWRRILTYFNQPSLELCKIIAKLS